MTQKDIARNMGVSLITVQRALNNSGYISKELQKKILDYAEKNSYVPHRASSALARNKNINIGIFSSADPKYFWDDIERGVKIVANQIKAFRYEVHYYQIPDFDTKKFLSVLKNSIRRGLDAAAFINQPVFDMKEIISTAEKAGIPYLMYNVDAPQTNRLCYIGANYRAGGRLAANFIGKALSLKKDGKVLVITSRRERISDYSPGPDINSDRLAGFLEYMKGQHPSIECIQENLISLLNDPSSDKQIFRILKGYEKRIDALYFIPAFNPSFHRALEQLDYRNVIVLQHDIDPAAMQGLEEDLITAVVYQDPVLQGYLAVRILEQFLESKKTKQPVDIEITHTLILRENIDFLRNHYLL
jgi:LacI family transcriptional regulator